MCLRKAVLLIAFVVVAGASGIIFPGQLDHAEGDDCATHSGATGTCVRACVNTADFGEPRKCGIKNSAFLVCCGKTLGVAPQPVTDIAPPPPTFQCGRNTQNFLEASFSFVDGKKIFVEPQDYNPAIYYNETITLANGTEVHVQVGVAGVGAERADKNAWPWMALVGERQGEAITWFCGAVLINEHWVLSALHCFFRKKPEVVRLGEHNYKDDNDGADHQDFGVTEMVPYPGYSHPEAYHDLALLRLASRVPLQEFISPVCLPWALESEVDITGHNVTLTGYGDTQFGGIPTSYLQEVNMTAFSSARCDTSYSNLPHYAETWPQGIGQETLCAGHPDGGRDACQGDSGGPLVSQDTGKRFVLAGIVSRGYGCGHKDYPGLYANLRHPPYLAWIKKVAFAAL